MPRSLFSTILIFLIAPLVLAQTSNGVLLGKLRAKSRQSRRNEKESSQDWKIKLRELSSRKVVQEAAPAEDGSFVLYDVPYAAYRLEVWGDSRQLADREVLIDGPLPRRVEIEFSEEASADPVLELPERLVKARGGPPSEPWNHTFYGSEAIGELMAPSRENAVEALLLQSADVVPDEDGRLHARGEDAQLLYVVDGIPMGGNPTRVYSSLFDASRAKSVDIRAGGLPAQYGAGSAVVAVTTLDGLDRPFAARIGGGLASYGTRESELQASGRIGGKTSLFLHGSRSETGRYLDPISGFDPNHGDGEGLHFFGKATSVMGARARLHWLGGYDATDYQIPNAYARNPRQDQAQNLDSYLAGVRLDLDLGPDDYLGVAAYSRRNRAHLTSGGLDRIRSASDSLKALAENERFFIGARREDGYHGGLIEYASRPGWKGKTHRFRAGIAGEANPLENFLSIAVTDSNLTAPGADTALAPFDLQRGGSPLESEHSRMGWTASAYVQDAFDAGKWTFIPGVRYDAFQLFDLEQSVSPRFAAAYALFDNLDLRGSLDLLVTRAPLENILLSSSDDLRPLAGDEQGSTSSRVNSEKALGLGLGANYRPNAILELDLDLYGKYLRDFLVKAELSNSGLIFPINLKEGLVAGGHLRVKLREWHRFSGQLSIGSCASIGLKPEDGSSPIAAGLLVGEEGRNYGHPWQGEDIFPTEHNQIGTAVLNLRYRLLRGLHATLGGRFDSGLPFDLADSAGNGLSPSEARAELKRRGYSDAVIDLLNLESEEPGSPDKSVAPHAVMDLGLDCRFPLRTGLALKARVAVLNVFDTDYLYKFESSFSSTHFGRPRTFGLWLAVDY
jgi:hypothetical protein